MTDAAFLGLLAVNCYSIVLHCTRNNPVLVQCLCEGHIAQRQNTAADQLVGWTRLRTEVWWHWLEGATDKERIQERGTMHGHWNSIKSCFSFNIFGGGYVGKRSYKTRFPLMDAPDTKIKFRCTQCWNNPIPSRKVSSNLINMAMHTAYCHRYGPHTYHHLSEASIWRDEKNFQFGSSCSMSGLPKLRWSVYQRSLPFSMRLLQTSEGWSWRFDHLFGIKSASSIPRVRGGTPTRRQSGPRAQHGQSLSATALSKGSADIMTPYNFMILIAYQDREHHNKEEHGKFCTAPIHRSRITWIPPFPAFCSDKLKG